ncbi:MAG: 6-phosphogluconolactonase [Verrucomicrobia bacterium]|nr:6-phosphogluconolactonase [Verrucomicrobiota bacterium]
MQTDVDPRVRRTAQFNQDAAALIIEAGREAISKNGLFRLGLAGGNTPRAVYEHLAAQPDALPWDKVQITFGDERCVPPEDGASNYRMAWESLLSRVPIPEANVFRVRGEIHPQEASLEYEAKLAAVASQFGEDCYAHDLLLLGLGEDGHTASLFPDSPALEETVRKVVPNTGPKPPPQRITFTYPLINAARRVLFLLKDPAKEPILQAALRGEFPSGRVRPTHGTVLWLVG